MWSARNGAQDAGNASSSSICFRVVGALIEHHRWEKDDAETPAGTCRGGKSCGGHSTGPRHTGARTRAHTRCPNDYGEKGSTLHNCEVHTHEPAHRNRATTCLMLSGSGFPQLLPLVVDVLAPAATASHKEAPSWQSQNEPSTSSPTWVGSRPTWHMGMMTFKSQMPHE